MSKPNYDVTVDFVGGSASDVTQSMYLITFKGIQILMDCGLYQSNNLCRDYRINHNPIKGLKPQEIDYIFISHAHTDHCGALPRLFAEGCRAKIIVPKGNKNLIGLMLKDCAKIFKSDAERLERNFRMKNVSPLYLDDDVDLCLDYIEEFDFGEMYELTKDIHFRFYHAGHILASAQILLQFQCGNLIKRIGYTGDIGEVHARQFCEKCEELPFVDVLIGESTYSQLGRGNNLPIAITQNILEQIVNRCNKTPGAKVIIPVFSLDRLQTVLNELEMLRYHTHLPTIIVDAPLGIEISKEYNRLSEDFDKANRTRWKRIWKDKNIIWNTDYNTSRYWQDAPCNAIVLTTSGMCCNGRSVAWLQKYLPNKDSAIVFVGYTGEKTTADYVCKCKPNAEVSIGGTRYRKRAEVTELASFSSHKNYKELMNYYSSGRFLRLYLVHGNMDSKALFASAVENHLRVRNNTAKVYAATQGLKITI